MSEDLTEFINQIERIEFQTHPEGCGLEDVGIADRYEAMEYGWEQAMIAVKNLIKEL